jgi:hypothetical protein
MIRYRSEYRRPFPPARLSSWHCLSRDDCTSSPQLAPNWTDCLQKTGIFFTKWQERGSDPRRRKDRPRNLTGIRKPILNRLASVIARDTARLGAHLRQRIPEMRRNLSGMTMQATELSKSVPWSWRPWYYSVHGRHRRIFPDDEGRSIREFIESNDLIPGHLL